MRGLSPLPRARSASLWQLAGQRWPLALALGCRRSAGLEVKRTCATTDAPGGRQYPVHSVPKKRISHVHLLYVIFVAWFPTGL